MSDYLKSLEEAAAAPLPDNDDPDDYLVFEPQEGAEEGAVEGEDDLDKKDVYS